ncbi:hypothetical protein C444_06306 [Haloarcula japonica DSM 6131]|uniref:Uncharacterized protein n=2 Tax=Haloarcula japonica TaxID=29282 RepID=M0LGR1_HALJT|nr:hypothetical protein C444_06306 [Haloarcula japonica DSM 6131]
MQILDSLVTLLTLILQLLLFFMLQLGVMVAITGGIGLAGGVLSVPVLSVLPDVRRFLVQASGGRPDDGTPSWRVVLRPRYLLLSFVFGILYGLTFVALLGPLIRLGLFPGRGEPTLSLALLPAVFVLASTLFAYGVHRYSSAWTGTATRRSVLAQWMVFLSVVVTVGTGSAYVAALAEL